HLTSSIALISAPPASPLLPYTSLFRSASPGHGGRVGMQAQQVLKKNCEIGVGFSFAALSVFRLRRAEAASEKPTPISQFFFSTLNRNSKRLNSTHDSIANAVFAYKKEI